VRIALVGIVRATEDRLLSVSEAFATSVSLHIKARDRWIGLAADRGAPVATSTAVSDSIASA